MTLPCSLSSTDEPRNDRSSHGLADRNSYVFGLLAGHPDDPSWMASMEACAEAIRVAKTKLNFGNRVDRRGSFKTVAFGVSYGGGQKVRTRITHKRICTY